MKIGIVGSRSFTSWEKFSAAIYKSPVVEIIDACKFNNEHIHVVTGDANGADELASRWAKENNLNLSVLKANWDLHGRSAGVLRNKDLVDEVDLLIAFWDGKSRGTGHTVSFGFAKKIPMIIIPI